MLLKLIGGVQQRYQTQVFRVKESKIRLSLLHPLRVNGAVCFALFLFFSAPVSAATVVVTIAPLAEALKPLLSKEDQIITILPKGQSPHHFQLKPSHAFQIAKADMLIQIGAGVDNWANKAFDNSNATVRMKFAELAGVMRLPTRKSTALAELEGQESESHEHQHEHEHEDEQEVAKHGQKAHSFDPHIWLDVGNILVLTEAFAAKLQQLQPQFSSQYQSNLASWQQRLRQMDKSIASRLKPVQSVPYLVLHDAFQYFEHRYGLNHIASIRPPSGSGSGLKQMVVLHGLIESQKIRCIFKEPQFSSRAIKSLAQQSQIKLGELDPLGDPDQDYAALLESMSDNFLQCLSSE